ncbi:glyoxylase-like metal-dependent hydrolase (beta-lactamase superfamily II) [Pseudoxanthomonas japonensis]|uniref:MBL fold metallo-hydrolase n=1 Tax=Pseudoxanthomonas japonensis TaxID=69284 RepID=UPI002861C639|nr:MBL fold metallo-hydrolase [Pseudoxanthomonas japonensis]MDR7067241.1 glyoxylase-like metal-dependent hydrolase (beta-lactamase superfamily II) [Pseudoxanthomonas japonensis]
MTTPALHAQFDEATNTISYVVWDPATRHAAVIDPVLDYDHRAGRASYRSVDTLLGFVADHDLVVVWILETHAHADHLSAAPYLKEKTGALIGIGERITHVQRTFAPVFGLDDVSGDGREFDRLFRDGDVFPLGELQVDVLHTPGHTPACVSYRIGDAVFVGDTLFMPDYGTARADFPGGDARTLYRSIQKLLALPPETALYLCHDYKAPGRDHYAWETTVADEKARNVHVGGDVDEDSFVAMREARDATLPAPALLLPSLQVNLRAGRLPEPEANGVRYLKIPLKIQGSRQEERTA